MAKKQMVKTMVRTKAATGVDTTTVVVFAAGIGIAAALGYFGVRSQESISQSAPRASAAQYKTPGYTTPGYGTPGYGTPGYGTPGYGTAGYQTVGLDSCATTGWKVDSVLSLSAHGGNKSFLIKGATGTAVYWYGADGKRHVFPNEQTYRSWFGVTCPLVYPIPNAELNALPIGENVTYKPGVRMIKITTDPKLYAVSKGGVIHWVKSETVASQLYGANWKMNTNDLPDAFFVNYTMGTAINSASDYNPASAQLSAPTIDIDKGL